MGLGNAAKKVTDTAQVYECIANYLKVKGMLDHKFKYYVQAENLDCDPILEKFRETMYETIVESEDLSKDDVSCFRDNLKALNFSDLGMKKFVYERARSLSKRKRKLAVRRIYRESEGMTNFVSTLCNADAVYGEFFDDFLAEKGSVHKSIDVQQQDICNRQYITDNKLIDSFNLTMEINPSNVNMDTIDCNGYIGTARNEFCDTLAEEYIKDYAFTKNDAEECIVGLMQSENLFDHYEKIFVLKEFEVERITTEIKALARADFIISMKIFQQKVVKCY